MYPIVYSNAAVLAAAVHDFHRDPADRHCMISDDSTTRLRPGI
jgi:hypothetical protein